MFVNSLATLGKYNLLFSLSLSFNVFLYLIIKQQYIFVLSLLLFFFKFLSQTVNVIVNKQEIVFESNFKHSLNKV